MTESRWIRKWEARGSKGATWTVSQDNEGNFGCSCPVWKFQRQECKHIQEIKGLLEYQKTHGLADTGTEKPKYVLAMVGKPTFNEEKNELLIPLVRFGDMHMEATICHHMLKRGYTMHEIRELRHNTPPGLNAGIIRQYMEVYGEAEYPMKEHQVDLEPAEDLPGPHGR